MSNTESKTTKPLAEGETRWGQLARLAFSTSHPEYKWFLARCEEHLRQTYECGFTAGVEAALRGVNKEATGCHYEKA